MTTSSKYPSKYEEWFIETGKDNDGYGKGEYAFCSPRAGVFYKGYYFDNPRTYSGAELEELSIQEWVEFTQKPGVQKSI